MQYIYDTYAAYYDDSAHILIRDDANPVSRFGAWMVSSVYRLYSPEGFKKWADAVVEDTIAKETDKRMRIIKGEKGTFAAKIEEAINKKIADSLSEK